MVEIIDGELVYHKLSLFETQQTNAHEIVYDASGILKPHSSVRAVHDQIRIGCCYADAHI